MKVRCVDHLRPSWPLERGLKSFWILQERVVLEKVEGLPEEDKHRTFLSADALQDALNDYMIKQKRTEI